VINDVTVFYGNFTDTFYIIKYYGYRAIPQCGQHCLHNNQSTQDALNFIIWRVGMKSLSMIIAVSVGIFWASIAALAFPSITLPVFLISCLVTFIAVGLCLAGSESTGFDHWKV
jgi:hypothetical protein